MTTKKEMVEYLESHPIHDSGNGYWPLPSWNIKVYGIVEACGDKRWDKRWEQYLKENEGWIFNHCCDAGLRPFFDKEYFIGVKGFDWLADYQFYVAGRMGGHLILDKIEMRGKYSNQVIKFNRDSRSVIDYSQLDYPTVRRIYKFFKAVDEFDATQAYVGELEFIREEKEGEWNQAVRDVQSERARRNGRRELIEYYGTDQVMA